MPSTTRTTKRVFLPKLKQFASFTDRQAMKVGHPTVRLHRPPTPLPAPKLPIDWAKTLSFPMDGNDYYGDCFLAAAEHANNTFTGNTGVESNFNEALTVKDCLTLSGGDNGQNQPLWASNTSGKPGATLSVQNDGNVVIYDTSNHPLWATNTEVAKG